MECKRETNDAVPQDPQPSHSVVLPGDRRESDKSPLDSSESPDDAVDEKIEEFKVSWRALKLDRKIELILAAAISGFAACQVFITCSNNANTSIQVDKIIASASQIGDASQKFADSADKINRGLGSAVGKLGDQAEHMEALAKTSDNANKIAESAVELQVSGYNPYLVITDLGGNDPAHVSFGPPPNSPSPYIVTRDHTSFQFNVVNESSGEARNIRWAISEPHQVYINAADSSIAGGIQVAVENGATSTMAPHKIAELEGHLKTEQPQVYLSTHGLEPEWASRHETGEWVYGELTWDSEVGSTHGWRRVFCFLIKADTHLQTIKPCGIAAEGVFVREAENRKANHSRREARSETRNSNP